MKQFLSFLCLLLLSTPANAQTQELTREAPMGERTSMFNIYPYLSANEQVSFPYFLIAPETIAPDKKYPLILVLHGRSGHAYGAWYLADQIKNKGMEAFVVVPVMGEKISSWMKNHFEDKDPEHPRPIDHVALMTQKVMSDFAIDPARVYVTGYSMGGVARSGLWRPIPTCLRPPCLSAALRI